MIHWALFQNSSNDTMVRTSKLLKMLIFSKMWVPKPRRVLLNKCELGVSVFLTVAPRIASLSYPKSTSLWRKHHQLG